MASDILILAVICTQIHLLFAFSLTVTSNHCVKIPITHIPISISHRRYQQSVFALKMAKTLPRDIKDTVNQLRQSIQSGLSARFSRMDIELPFAVNFGVERSTANSKDLQLCLHGTFLGKSTFDTSNLLIIRNCFQSNGSLNRDELSKILLSPHLFVSNKLLRR
jgi:hypothetical protein